MNWRTVLRSLKNRDMQKRLGIVLGLLIAYRFLSHIPVPLADPTELRNIINTIVSSSDFGGFLNLMSGGALAQIRPPQNPAVDTYYYCAARYRSVDCLYLYLASVGA